MKHQVFALSMALLLTWATGAAAATLQVGPTRAYTTVSDAVDAAGDGDTIEIDSGTYATNYAWGAYYKNNLTFRGVGPTRPVLDAHHGAYNQQGIFILYGNNNTVENLEFYNTRDMYYKNASGIRIVGAGLTVRNCYFHDCDDGVMGGASATSDILMEYCEFDHCGYGDGQSHNIYIGNIRSFTIRYSWTHNAVEGHDIKTRAAANYILYNRITDETGTASYEITVPNGGTTYVIGNMIQQGPNSHNGVIIDYASEGVSAGYDKHLYVVSNTIVDERGGGPNYFVRNAPSNSAAGILVQNNVCQYQSGDALVSGPGTITQTTNWWTQNAFLRDQAGFNYRLTAASSGALDKGTTVPTGLAGYVMTPTKQYVYPCATMARPTDGTLDMGAFEYTPNQAPTVSAGLDRDVYEGQAVQLHAAASDPDGDPLTYAWTRTTAGLSITLTGTTSADASFTAPVVATRTDATQVFSVSVSDGLTAASTGVNVRIRIAGDINHDDTVDVVDLLTLAAAWGSTTGQPGFDPLCDLNGNGTVDAIDLVTLAANWTRTLQ